MRRLNMLIEMTVMVFVATGSAKGITSPGPLRLYSDAVVASSPPSLPAVNGDESLSEAIFPTAPNFTIGQLFVVATAEDGEKNPQPRSTHCPPDKDDHKGADNQDNKDKDNKDKDNKDKDNKDNHENCGKGDEGKNP